MLLSLGLVLMQTFLVIFLGALVIRVGMVRPEDTRVIGCITGRLALPLLIFRAVATAKIQEVDFSVVGVLVGSKLAVQFLTMAGAALLASPKPGQRLLDAGLYGLYGTSSADFPIGFPVVMALFQRQSDMMDDFCSYLTMLAVAQDLLGNVVALLALEAGRAQQQAVASASPAARPRRRSLLRAIVLNVAGNHLLWMVAAGLAYKAVFGWSLTETPEGLKLPVGLREAVAILTSPFKFLVLFQVGISVGSLSSRALFADPLKCLGVLLLNLIKLLFLPLTMVSLLLLTWSGPLEQRNRCMTFTLIYGTLPSPAAIVAFANMYGFSSDVVALAVPMGLIMSGPIIWMVAALGHLYMHSTDSMWHSDPRLERYMQYPGLACGVCVLVLFATGCREWRRFPTSSFAFCAVAVVGWHVTKLILMHTGCMAPAVVHYLSNVFNQQERLFGVMAVWMVWGLLRGVPVVRLKAAFVAVLCVLPLGTALPSLLGPDVHERPFWIMSCLYFRGPAQRIADLAACGFGAAALLTAVVLLALAGGFRKVKRAKGLARADSGGADLSSVVQSSKRSLQLHPLASLNPLSIDALSPAAAGPLPSPACAGQAATAVRRGASAEPWDEALRYRMFMLPALAMGLFAAVLLPLDALLALLRLEMSTAWRAAITTGAALVHCSQGCALLLLFCWSEPACRLYRGAFSWFTSCWEFLHAGGEGASSASNSESEEGEEEDLSAAERSSSGPAD